ncbi:2-hydroxychromene-2-carboxylate isomerase [Usitatibacter palustris]|uniref:2-hydroxychromene-2-carboxylate isomerase n=1 Tax=Usitatibacter palustris TaxID=2732487 RepID=A0A6M4H765_9PROT|nr:2-hydroxychromene-2-carboxylate isomerase [Usitatibacter palustris]QJR15222.1 2-hydroxychromene-2-carboxylate isomerase [Usitatibacter palustris]
MAQGTAIDYYFDFSSPYGYVASHLVDGLAQRTGRAITWRPMLIGAVMKVTGQPLMASIPLKGDYSIMDFSRTARFHGVPYKAPSTFPVSSIAGVRAFYWLQDKHPALAVPFAKALYAAYFAEDRDISLAETVIEIAAKCGVDPAALSAALADPAVKDRTKQIVDASLALRVFGSPYFIVDGEPFWGVDRIPMLEEWVRRGGW